MSAGRADALERVLTPQPLAAALEVRELQLASGTGNVAIRIAFSDSARETVQESLRSRNPRTAFNSATSGSVEETTRTASIDTDAGLYLTYAGDQFHLQGYCQQTETSGWHDESTRYDTVEIYDGEKFGYFVEYDLDDQDGEPSRMRAAVVMDDLVSYANVPRGYMYPGLARRFPNDSLTEPLSARINNYTVKQIERNDAGLLELVLEYKRRGGGVDRYAYTIDPERGFAVTQLLRTRSGGPVARVEASEFSQTPEGIWLARRVLHTQYDLNREGQIYRTIDVRFDENFRVGVPVDSGTFSMFLPVGVPVHDNLAGKIVFRR